MSGVLGPVVSSGTQSGISVIPSNTVGLQVLIAGEFNAGGNLSLGGKNTSPLNFTAGTPFLTTVNTVDQYWNVTPSSNPTVNVVTTDTNATAPGSKPLASGTTAFVTTLVTAGAQTLTASGAGTPNTSSAITINPGQANRLLVVLPGEGRVQGKQTAPAGKNGATPLPVTAGQTLLATVYGVDSFYNTDTNAPGDLVNAKIWASLPNDSFAVVPSSQSLVAGSTVFALVPLIAETQVVLATSALATPNATSANFSVNPDTITSSTQRVQLVFSGETADPGLPPYGITNGGKTGAPSPFYAGIGSTVTVQLVDQFYNLITNAVTTNVDFTTNDGNVPSNPTNRVNVVNGVGIGTMTFYTQYNAFCSDHLAEPAGQ